MRTRWQDLTPEKKRIIVVVVILEIISTIFAFGDLSDRSDADVRVSKRFWRLLMLSNPGNSIIYWVAGRR